MITNGSEQRLVLIARRVDVQLRRDEQIDHSARDTMTRNPVTVRPELRLGEVSGNLYPVGPTDAAGGLVDGDSWGEPAAARDALERADAGPYLEAQGALFVTGPTNTNVMDLAIVLVE